MTRHYHYYFNFSIIYLIVSICRFLGQQQVVVGSSSQQHHQQKPNIILLVCESTDGRTYRRGYQDDILQLPNIRYLEDLGGISFYKHYTNIPVCCPSRATLWSGKHAHKIKHYQKHHHARTTNHKMDDNSLVVNGVWNNYEGLPVDYNETIFHILQNNGYATHLSGKYDYSTGGHSLNAQLSAWTMYTQFPYNINAGGGWDTEDDVCRSDGTVHENDNNIESNYWHDDWGALHGTISWMQNHTTTTTTINQ
jgi:arylsulfatase K